MAWRWGRKQGRASRLCGYGCAEASHPGDIESAGDLPATAIREFQRRHPPALIGRALLKCLRRIDKPCGPPISQTVSWSLLSVALLLCFFSCRAHRLSAFVHRLSLPKPMQSSSSLLGKDGTPIVGFVCRTPRPETCWRCLSGSHFSSRSTAAGWRTAGCRVDFLRRPNAGATETSLHAASHAITSARLTVKSASSLLQGPLHLSQDFFRAGRAVASDIIRCLVTLGRSSADQ